MREAVSCFALMCAACAGEVVRVVPDGIPTGGTAAAASDPTFEVVARLAGAKDPLPVSGSSVAYADLERALGEAVLRSVHPRHDSVLTVELIAADASYDRSRLAVSLVARGTLRSRIGNAFVAQTQVVCRDGAIMPPDAGSRVLWFCMTRLGHDLGGWLEDLPPNP